MRKILLTLLFTGFLIAGATAQHNVTLKSGEKMTGTVKSINNNQLEFLFKGNIMKISVDDIYSIHFSQGESGITGKESTASEQREIGEKQAMAGSYMVRYKVADRIISKPPRIDNLTQEKGTVVVEITINKYGNVMKAIPGAPGSTTESEYLRTKAKQAAESTIFNNVPTAPLEQKGYMVIVF